MAAAAPSSGSAARSGALILLYDGVCALCNGTVRFALRHDRTDRVRVAALQSRFAAELLARHGRSERDFDTVCVVEDYGLASERLLVKSDAILHLLGAFGGVWRLSGLLRLLPRAVRDRAYAVVVRNRYRWFGRYDGCPLPAPAQRAKFIVD